MHLYSGKKGELWKKASKNICEMRCELKVNEPVNEPSE